MELEHIIGGAPSPVIEQAVEASLRSWLDTSAPAPSEPWTITSLGAADWAMARLAELRRIEREYRDQIALWTDAQRRATAGAEFFKGHLEDWALAQRTDKRKSFPLAHGTVTTRENRARLIVVDDDAAITWCAKNAPDALKVTTSVKVSEVPLKVGEVITGYRATHKTTGEEQTQWLHDYVRSDVATVAAVAARLGDDWTVEAILGVAVVDDDGHPVQAGFGVQPSHVSATVTPLLP